MALATVEGGHPARRTETEVETAMPASTRSSEALHDAALELIAESGLNALTLVAVAERAGVSRATAYREFNDKDGLIGAVARSEVAKMVAAAYSEIDLFAPIASIVGSVTLFALSYLRQHRAFDYIRRHEPTWLLDVAITHDGTEVNLVQTVAALAAPVVTMREGDLNLPPLAAAEVVVRIVLSHILLAHSNLTDDQIAETAIRAVSRPAP
ncbi:helix-turn-helix domain-containing protein [Nocardia beijingensis]|uniref:TetR/AcrR family transcriptional regulator n=1 Tax=Nocardia beijingensis TaxID=95162 RepID=UPI0033292743